MKRAAGLLFAVVAGSVVVFGGTTRVGAITLTVTGADGGHSTRTGSTGDAAAAGALILLDAFGSADDSVGSMITAATRYVSNAAADREVALPFSPPAGASFATDYILTFSISAPSGLEWKVDIGTFLVGGLTALDDAFGLAESGSAGVTGVTGKHNEIPRSNLSLLDVPDRGGTDSTSGTQTSISLSSPTYTVSGSGAGSFELRFQYSVFASSPTNVFVGGDEQAARFGFGGFGAASILDSATADDYPGPPGARRGPGFTLGADGHTVSALLTVLAVPEPSTLALLGIGALALDLARRPSRRGSRAGPGRAPRGSASRP